MKKGRVSSGYTIVEVIIVLAVSSTLLISGLFLVGNQQQRAEVTSSSHDVKEVIDGVINTVSSGYYQNRSDFTCDGAGAWPIITATAPGAGNEQGTNSGCIFIGKAIQFGVNSEPTKFNVYSLAGLRYRAGTKIEAASISDASPVALAHSALNMGASDSDIENNTLGYGLKVFKVKINGVDTGYNTIAFVTDFATTDANNNLSSGSRSAGLYSISNVTGGDDSTSAASNIYAGHFSAKGTVNNATICFSTGVKKYAILTIGSNGRQLSTNLKIINDNPPPAAGTPCGP